ncbi:MAG: prolyl oligopeptidase family serine peptidase [Planctomycetota bacterium]
MVRILVTLGLSCCCFLNMTGAAWTKCNQGTAADDPLPLTAAGHNSGSPPSARVQGARDLAGRYQGKVQRERLDWHWLDNGRAWYGVAVAPGRLEYFWVDSVAGTRKPLYQPDALAAALAAETGSSVEPAQLRLEGLSVESDGIAIVFRWADKWWRFRNDEAKLEPAERPAGQVLLPQSRVLRSRGQGPETFIRFVNQTDEPLRLWWVQADGNRTAYGTVEPGSEREQHTFAGHAWLVTRGESEVRAAFRAVEGGGEARLESEMQFRPESEQSRQGRGNRRPAPAPVDTPWRTEVVDGKLLLMAKQGDRRIELGKDGTDERPYQGPFLWSPDGQYLLCTQLEPGDRRMITLIDSRPDDQVQPKQQTIRYDKPGDRLDRAWPRLFRISPEGGEPVPLSTELYANPWSLNEFRWESDSSRFTMLYNQRGHQVLRWLSVEPSTGSTSILWEESSPTFVDYAHKQQRRELPETNELLWMSERNGWCHLYLHDSRTGEVKHPVTKGEWVVRSIVRLDAEARQVWLEAGGFHSGEDPYHRHLLRAALDGGEVVSITAGDGDHEWTFSPDGRFILDRYSRVDLPPVHQVRDALTGRLLLDLETADWGELRSAGWQVPERFVAKGRDGITDIYGIIVRPSHFEVGKKYPVIEEIYAGPQGAHVPKSFSLLLGDAQLAELGFIVVRIDGMGTSQRSKAFHDVCWKNLADAGFPDRRLWLEAAARKHPELDLSRVGITGGSAGGQNALGALLFHGDFYHAAVADCGCHDNRMDKVWWNELWMGWPLEEHYAEQSNVTQAHRLRGALLLIVGELDSNVDPASTLQVADALIKADKDFELLYIPGAGHGVGGSPYGRRKTWEFFIRHLLNE